MFEQVEVANLDKPLAIPAILPKLIGTPGSTEWPGGAVGSHTDELLGALGLNAERIISLRKNDVV
jgi:crotonobetainyl-CoA:carnitine CoA-transferase CaiB-like acyl-CoA transferase